MQVTFFADFCKKWAISAICIVFLIKVAILSLIGGAVMVEKLATDLIAQMIENKIIVKEMADRYIYTFICFVEKFLTIGSIILISLITRNLPPTIFFLIFFFELRKRTGGYHLDKFYKCYFATVAIYLAVMLTAESLAKYPQWLFGLVVIATIYIVIIGTVNHPNMQMNAAEFMESKKLARLTVLLEVSIILGCVFLGASIIYISYMAIAVILCAALLYISKIFKQEVTENEKC